MSFVCNLTPADVGAILAAIFTGGVLIQMIRDARKRDDLEKTKLRAYVFASLGKAWFKFEGSEAGKCFPMVSLTLTNHGQTAAKNVHYFYSFHPLKFIEDNSIKGKTGSYEGLEDDEIVEMARDISKVEKNFTEIWNIGPNKREITNYSGTFTKESWEIYSSKNFSFILYGGVIYDDVFDDRWEIKFAWRALVTNGIANYAWPVKTHNQETYLGKSATPPPFPRV